MPMIPFMEKFPALAARETRSLLVRGREDLPDGDYGFLELYCDEPGCDCRRVMIAVARDDPGGPRILANINYGWESPDFYKQWGGRDLHLPQGPFLDPMNPQSKCARTLLKLFQFVLQSPEYIPRLQRHYQMFREKVDAEKMRKNKPSRRMRVPSCDSRVSDST
jgi:hypothetical protein